MDGFYNRERQRESSVKIRVWGTKENSSAKPKRINERQGEGEGIGSLSNNLVHTKKQKDIYANRKHETTTFQFAHFLQLISFVITSVALIVSQRLGTRRLNLVAAFKRANSNVVARGNGASAADESNPLLTSTDDRSSGESGSGSRENEDAIERLVPIEDLMYSQQVTFQSVVEYKQQWSSEY